QPGTIRGWRAREIRFVNSCLILCELSNTDSRNANTAALMTMKANDLAQLVKQKIENLRPKLLDLSRRNPLIATKLGPRSNSHIRVVDELPDILFYKLNNGQEMPLVPLPPIDDDPPHAPTSALMDALINARLTDEQYLVEIESVERNADDYMH